MGLTVTIKKESWAGTQKVVDAEIAFDASYPTGGESLTAAMLRLAKIETIEPFAKSGYVFEYDYTNKKMLAYHYDYDAVADGAAIQVADTTDLSAVTGVRIVARGY